MDLEDRDALGLGGMRGQDRPDAGVSQQRLDRLGRNARPRRLPKHMGEGARDLLRTALGLGVPQAPYGRVLLGEGDELEPDPEGLEATEQEVLARRRDRRLAAQDGLDLRLPAPHDSAQEPEQGVEHLAGIADRLSRFGGFRYSIRQYAILASLARMARRS